MSKKSYLIASLLFLYFALSDYPRFNIFYNGIALIISLCCIILFIVFYRKDR